MPFLKPRSVLSIGGGLALVLMGCQGQLSNQSGLIPTPSPTQAAKSSTPTTGDLALSLKTTVRTMLLKGDVTTWAGEGSSGWSDSATTSARFDMPVGVAVDRQGQVYVADSGNNCVRMILTDGTVQTLAGSQTAGREDGSLLMARFDDPTGLALDTDGTLYVADTHNNAIRKITPTGYVSTFVSLSSPTGLVLDASHDLYVAETGRNAIDRISPDGTMQLFAGSEASGSTDGALNTARFDRPMGLAIDASGALYVADSGNNCIKVIRNGQVSTLAGLATVPGYRDGKGSAAMFDDPMGIAVTSFGEVFVADTGNQCLRAIDRLGNVTTIAGSVTGDSDGVGSAALFDSPQGLALDPSGDLFVGDTLNHCIRKVS